MSAAELLSACGRIDAAAAALRVYVVACADGSAEETSRDNVATRQVALRGIVCVIEQAREFLLGTTGGDDFDSLELLFFVEMVSTAEQALWVVLSSERAATPATPSNADLCELLGLALQFHAQAFARRPAGSMPRQAVKGGAA